MKTKTYAVTDAFAWDKSVLMKTLMKENNRSWIAFGADLSKVIDNADLSYYSDAVKQAIAAYAVEKKLVLDKTIKVTMTVKTKDGVEHPYNVSAGCFGGSPLADLDTLKQEIAMPLVAQLVIGASGEIPFADVKSVSCYVEEVEYDPMERRQ